MYIRTMCNNVHFEFVVDICKLLILIVRYLFKPNSNETKYTVTCAHCFAVLPNTIRIKFEWTARHLTEQDIFFHTRIHAYIGRMIANSK